MNRIALGVGLLGLLLLCSMLFWSWVGTAYAQSYPYTVLLTVIPDRAEADGTGKVRLYYCCNKHREPEQACTIHVRGMAIPSVYVEARALFREDAMLMAYLDAAQSATRMCLDRS